MFNKKSSRIVAALVATLLVVQVFSGGLTGFAESFSSRKQATKEETTQSLPQANHMFATVSEENDHSTDAVEEDATEASTQEAEAGAEEDKTSTPESSTPSEKEGSSETSKTPEKEDSTAPESSKEENAGNSESSTSPESSKEDTSKEEVSEESKKPEEELEVSKPPEEPEKPDEGTLGLGASGFVVTIEDPYVGLSQEALDDMSEEKGETVTSLFTVTYEKDGNTVNVKSGDTVPAGTVLDIKAEPNRSPVSIYINGEVVASDDSIGNWPTLTIPPHTVTGDVKISTDPVMGETFVANYSTGGGQLPYAPSGAGDISSEFNKILDGDAGNVVGFPGPHGMRPDGYKTYTYKQYYGSASTSWSNINRTFAYDNFLVTMTAGQTLTLDLAKLRGRTVTISGEGTVAIKAGAMQTYTIFHQPASNGSYVNSPSSGGGTTPQYYTSITTPVPQVITLNSGVKFTKIGSPTAAVTGKGTISGETYNTNAVINVSGGGSTPATNGKITLAGSTHLYSTGNISLANADCSAISDYVWSRDSAVTIGSGVNFPGTVNQLRGNTISVSGDLSSTTFKIVDARTTSGTGLSVSGKLKATDVYARTSVTGTATFTNLYGKGYLNLGGNGTYGSVFGGGTSNKTALPAGGATNQDQSNLNGAVNATISAGTISTRLYGGGDRVNTGAVILDINGGNFTGATYDIYGGGLDSSCTSTNTTLKTRTKKSIYGGGHAAAAAAAVTNNSKLTVENTTVDQNVYAGGHAPATFSANTGSSTLVLNGATVSGTDGAYGGGHTTSSGTANTGSVSIEIKGTNSLTGTMYGGGHAGGSGTAKVASGISMSDATNARLTAAHFYGGGNSDQADASVGGSISTLLSNTTVSVGTGNIYGGGRSTTKAVSTVGGSVTTEMKSATATDFYGGGHATSNAATVGTTVTTELGTVTLSGSFHGGGHGVSADATVGGKVSSTINGGTVADSVYGGGHAIGGKSEVASVALTLKDVTVTEDIFGGAHSAGTATANTATIDGDVNLTLIGTIKQGDTTHGTGIYGGSNATTSVPAEITGKITISQSGTTAATITAKSFYGGSYAQSADANIAHGVTTDLPDSTITITDAGEFVGGSIATASGTANIGGDVATTLQNLTADHSIYGGSHTRSGLDANIDGDVSLKVTGLAKTNTAHLYGGSYNEQGTGTTTISGDVTTDIGTATIKTDIYGGSFNDSATGTSNITKNVSTKIGTATTANIYGGSHTTKEQADIDGLTGVKLTVNEAQVTGDIYGGSHNDTNATETSNITGAVETSIGNTTTLSTIDGNFYGGSHTVTGNDATVGVKISSKIQKTDVTGSVYGAGHTAGAGSVDVGTGNTGHDVSLEMWNGSHVTNDLFGGGHSTDTTGTAHVHGDVTVKLDMNTPKNSIIDKNVYGGGTSTTPQQAQVNGHVTLQSAADVNVDLYGGGYQNDILNKDNNFGTKVELHSGGQVGSVQTPAYAHVPAATPPSGSLFGGGHKAEVKGDIDVTTFNTSVVTNNVYGGGYGNGADADITGRVHVIIGGNVKNSVFGAGIDQSPVSEYTKVEVVNGLKPDGTAGTGNKVDGDVYGGGPEATSGVMSQDTAGTIGTNGRYNTTNVIIRGDVGKNVYGGSHDSEIPNNASVTVEPNSASTKPVIDGTVYGGGRIKDVVGITTVTVVDGTVKGTGTTGKASIFGGGTDGSKVLNKDASGAVDISRNATTVLIKTGTFENDIYGAGEKTSAPSPTAGSSAVTMEKGLATKDIYGGGLESSIDGSTKVVVGLGTTAPSAGERKDADVRGTIYGGGHGLGSNILHPTRGTEVTLNAKATAGRVFGGSHDNSDSANVIKGTEGTKVVINGVVSRGTPYVGGTKESGTVYGAGWKAELPATTTDGTKVTVNAIGIVERDVFGGGWESDVRSQEATNVTIFGQVWRNVYGGGRDGDVTEVRGPKVVVSDGTAIVGKSANNYGLLENGSGNVYGGGYGETTKGNVQNTSVKVIKGSNVMHSVYGGGRQNNGTGASATKGHVAQNTNVLIDGSNTAIGIRERAFAADNWDELLKNNSLTNFMHRGEYENTGVVTVDPTNGYEESKWIQVGNIYGGGSWATIGGNTKVVINNTRQVAYNRISGGNLGLASANAQREIDINNFGKGLSSLRPLGTTWKDPADLMSYYYTNTSEYIALRFLQDYQTCNAVDSYLTVYYNLKSTDDGSSIHGIDHDTQGTPAFYNSTFNVTRGTYRPWRPQPHTNVRVEPHVIIHDYAKMRMEGNYSVHFTNDITTTNQYLPSNPLKTTSNIHLLIDTPLDPSNPFIPHGDRKNHSGTTSKIYGPNDKILKDNTFDYSEIMETLVVRELRDQGASYVTGIEIYVPPTDLGSTGVDPNHPGGSTKPDTGSSGGSSGGGGGGRGGAGGAGGGGSAGGITPPSAKPYITDDKVVANHETTVDKGKVALQKVPAGKTIAISEKKSGQISAHTLQEMGKLSQKSAGALMYYGDTVTTKNVIEGRMYINVEQATGVKNTIFTGVYTSSDKTIRTARTFQKYYRNKVAVVHMAHQGPLGMTVKIAAKVDLSGLNTKALHFYVYDTKTNSYSIIQNPQYFVDSKGYVYFHTNVGGDIIITDAPLQSK